MKFLTYILIAMLTLWLTNAAAQESKIEVTTSYIQDIDININPGHFVTIQLDNEIKGFLKLGIRNLQAEQLNNKTIVIYPYDNNLPFNLGKIILTDKYCNKYALNLLMNNAKEEQKDVLVHISNSNKEESCDAVENKNTFPKAGTILYKQAK